MSPLSPLSPLSPFSPCIVEIVTPLPNKDPSAFLSCIKLPLNDKSVGKLFNFSNITELSPLGSKDSINNSKLSISLFIVSIYCFKTLP